MNATILILILLAIFVIVFAAAGIGLVIGSYSRLVLATFFTGLAVIDGRPLSMVARVLRRV